MPYTLREICGLLEKHGFRPTLHGDEQVVIASVATLEDARASQISFLANPKYEKLLQNTQASAVVVNRDAAAPDHLNLVRLPDPYAAITALIVELHGYRQHRRFAASPAQTYISPSATVGENASIYPGVVIDDAAIIGENAVLYPGVYIGPRCRIGANFLAYPNVVIYDDAIIGDRVTIHAGSVVGNDGLGYAPVGGKWVKIPQIGHVEIGDDVEIGSNCSIDRATLGRTVIGRGTKMSNLIAIGHGAQIGEHCMLVAQVGLAGSVSVGHHVTMAGQAGIVGHIRVGDHAKIGAKAGVTHDVPDGETVLGQPAIPIAEMRRQVVYVNRLPDLTNQVKQHEKRIEELERKAKDGNGPE